jgi:recombination protein RecA
VVAEIQRNGGTPAFVDAEHALDPRYVEKLGVNTNDLLVSQPDTGEQALELTLRWFGGWVWRLGI